MKRIKELRSSKQLTQTQLAEQLNVTQQTIAQWENGRVTPSGETLEELARVLETTVSYLKEEDLQVSFKVFEHRMSKATSVDDVDSSDLFEFGHQFIGVQVYADSPIQWYPIGQEMSERLVTDVYAVEWEKPFLIVETLNNKTLFINKEKVHHIEIEMGEIPIDYDINWDGDFGLSNLAVYTELELLRGLGYFPTLVALSESLYKPSTPTEVKKPKEIDEFILLNIQERETLQLIKDIYAGRINFAPIAASLDDVNIYLKDKQKKKQYDVSGFEPSIWMHQLSEVTKECWLNFGEGNDDDRTRGKYYRSSDCYFIEVPTTVFDDSMQYKVGEASRKRFDAYRALYEVK